MNRKYTIAVLVNNQPGVLQRVSGLFGRRGFNIESITVGASEEPGLSRMVIVTGGDDKLLEQVSKQLYKLIDVIKVIDVSANPMVERELALIKVTAEPSARPEILGVVETFRAAVVDIGPSTLIVQAVGGPDKIDAMIELLRPYGIRELSRTGVTAMNRGAVRS
ncbi:MULTISPECIES: acetolactate synthase small subunit [unclassified Paenibacillus]|uniref:acetolactate synthase small subunit n=1 Tax=unclassified Paenibacillus TaxID=185978 RepID=UPI000957537D|nr:MULTISPECIES: acetolactate synthase small subunit [unclassified Paenibacillus]ASS68890.1 acetolactate synthase small subunit [Paenibacillus sp. RUD330]SIR15890.1 acetolactate synthase, small subunit [Paenibacillus sp. RU4X]SIR22054.1 acetolactate synthase, small subunit [Paenibacillus sp. RU4T]